MPRDRRERKRVVVYRAEIPGTRGGIHTAEYEAVADALHFACRDLREGRRIPLEIAEDGVVVHDAAGIARECGGGGPH
ncbi:MAG TPA: hypothetical protein VHG51_12485 [Longimicrobiaceae bacterium]|nr:hypothetical protein [Longimicrobiaceae bacterium]